MTASRDNPIGLDGFEFVEFTSPDPKRMVELLTQLGFVATHIHPTKEATRFRQGDISLIVNNDAGGQAAEFRKAHGPSANGMAFRVADAKAAFNLAVENGAHAADKHAGLLGEDSYVLQGIGGSLLYLVDRYGDRGSLYEHWTPVVGADEAEARETVGLKVLDHLTHNVKRGQMRTWSSFYNQVFGFEEQKYFNIKGQQTALFSQAMIAPDGAIRIPLNESQDEHSQIEEFIREYNGECIHHIALTSDEIYGTIERLRERGVKLQDTIETYYELVDERVPGHGEDLERMRKNRILLDGNEEEGLLLQIFTENLFGPIFFEIIQRKGNAGFGAGNFQALFESIELDQQRRGVLPPQTAAKEPA